MFVGSGRLICCMATAVLILLICTTRAVVWELFSPFFCTPAGRCVCVCPIVDGRCGLLHKTPFTLFNIALHTIRFGSIIMFALVLSGNVTCACVKYVVIRGYLWLRDDPLIFDVFR